MRILVPPDPKPKDIIEIRVIRKVRTCPTDNRSYSNYEAKMMQVTDTSIEEVYNLILERFQEIQVQKDDPLAGQVHPAVLRRDMEKLLHYATSKFQLTSEDYVEMDAITKRWDLADL